LEDDVSLVDQIQTWTWIQLAHTRPSSWQAVPWSVSISFLSRPSFKAKHQQYDGLFHHGISQWCYNTRICWAGAHRAPGGSASKLSPSSYW